MANISKHQPAVAMIGLGTMGGRIAARLLAAGYAVAVFNRTSARAQPLFEQGARLCMTATEAVHDADVVFTSLRGGEVERDAALKDDGGFMRVMRKGALHVSLSTLAPAMASQLAESHRANATRYLACQVQGRAQAAEAGKLLLWVSGPSKDLEEIAPVLASFAAQTCYLGERIDIAPATKLAVNMLMFANIELFAETSAYLQRCGANPAQVLGVLTESMFAAPLFKGIAGSLQGTHAADGTNVATSLLDLQMLMEHAGRVGAHLPAAAAVTAQFDATAKRGFAALAQSAVLLPLSGT